MISEQELQDIRVGDIIIWKENETMIEAGTNIIPITDAFETLSGCLRGEVVELNPRMNEPYIAISRTFRRLGYVKILSKFQAPKNKTPREDHYPIFVEEIVEVIKQK